MKKRLILTSMLTMAGVLAVGTAFAVGANKNVQVKNVEAASESTKPAPDFTTYLPISNGSLEPTDGSSGNLGDLIRWRDTRFWTGNVDPNNFDSQERSYNSMDEFVTTFLPGDGWRGNYRTAAVTLADEDHRYVSFLFSGKDNGEIFLNVWHEARKGGAAWEGEYHPDVYNRNVVAGLRPFFDETGSFDGNKGKEADEKLYGPATCNMTFRYLRIPDSVKPGDQFLLFVRDGSTGGFGGFAFGDVHVNQTLEDCARSFSAHKAQMKLNSYMSDWTRNANKYVLDNIYISSYSDNYYAPLITVETALADANDDFEVNDHLANWAYDMENSSAMINFSTIYSDVDYKNWTEAQPANKSGNLYLNADTSGVGENEKYRLVSSAFKLNDLGLVSIKLGGNTSKIELLRADTLQQLEEVTNPNFKDGDAGDVIGTDTRQNTMTRLFIDWSAYKYSTYGYMVRIAISDYRTGGNWGLAYFDELVTNHSLNTVAFKADVIAQGSKHGVILDDYSGNANTDFGKAFDFMETYYSVVRNRTNNYGYCSSDSLGTVISKYNGLTDVQQAIVDRSEDFDFFTMNDTRTADWALNNVRKDNTVGQMVRYIAARFGFSITIKNAAPTYQPVIVADKVDMNSIILIAVVSSVAIISLVAFISFKKRKQD